MDKLSHELLASICEHVVSKVDLKALSVLNSRWAAATRPYLFRRIHVFAWPTCLGRLKKALDQPVVRSYAKELNLHLPHMPEFRSNDLIRAANNPVARPWWSKKGRPQDKELKSRHNLEETEYSNGIKQLTDSSFWVAIKEAIRLPITRIVIDADNAWTGLAEIWSMMAYVKALPVYVDVRVAEIASAMDDAGILKDIVEVNLQRLPPRLLAVDGPKSIAHLGKLVERAERVHMSFEPPEGEEEEVDHSTHYCSFLGCKTLPDCTKNTLKELVVLWNMARGYEHIAADIPIGPAYDCYTLRRLSLGGLSLTFGVFQGMLDNVRDTLQCLELYEIQMRIYSDEVPNSDTTPRGFFCALVENHHLQEAKFEGFFEMDDMCCDFDDPLPSGMESRWETTGAAIAEMVATNPTHHYTPRDGQPEKERMSKEMRIEWIRDLFDQDEWITDEENSDEGSSEFEDEFGCGCSSCGGYEYDDDVEDYYY